MRTFFNVVGSCFFAFVIVTILYVGWHVVNAFRGYSISPTRFLLMIVGAMVSWGSPYLLNRWADRLDRQETREMKKRPHLVS